jgi:hypothetical protein
VSLPSRVPEVLLAVASVGLTLLCAELAIRAIGYDLSGRTAAFEANPIFYRKPTVPVGSVYFRRPGPAVWEGNVPSAGFRAALPAAAALDPYRDEPEIRVRYDAQGFRNPEGLSRWEIAVVGDSFTELGHLPEEDLFTTRLAELTGRTVRNLGVSYTGTFAHAFYLASFGPSPALTDSVLVFYEGNDLQELMAERATLRRFRKTGVRPERSFEPQTSLVGYLRDRLRSRPTDELDAYAARAAQEIARPNAYFVAPAGETPLTLWFAPLGPDALRPGEMRALRDALREWARAARELDSQPWLAYMPTARRALHGHLRFTAAARPEVSGWQPSGFPEAVRRITEGLSIRFVDLTPALEAEAAAGVLPYSPIWDTHLSPAGSHAVGRALAAALSAPRRE